MDQQHLERVRNFYRTHRRLPSYKELFQLTGFHSRSSVWKLLNRLQAAGHIKKDRHGKISPHRLFGTIPVLGIVEAGFASPAEEYRTDDVSLDELLIPNKVASFLLTVRGDSMKDAGILEGDLVIAERTAAAKTGDIVIAALDGAYTMKYYRTKNGKAYLEAANARFKPMYPKQSLVVEAVVRSVVRKYR